MESQTLEHLNDSIRRECNCSETVGTTPSLEWHLGEHGFKWQSWCFLFQGLMAV